MNVITCRVIDVIDNKWFIISDGKTEKRVTREELEQAIASGRLRVDAIKAESVYKYRDKQGNIVGYQIEDINGTVIQVNANKLKDLIRNYQLDVIDLTLTSDGRLIDAGKQRQRKQPQPLTQQSNNYCINLRKEMIEELEYHIAEEMLNKRLFKGVNIEFIGKNGKLGLVIKDPKNFDITKMFKPIQGTPLSMYTYGNGGVYHVRVLAIDTSTDKPIEGDIKMPRGCRYLFKDFNIADKLHNLYMRKYNLNITEKVPNIANIPISVTLDGLDWSDTEIVNEMFANSKIDRVIIKRSQVPSRFNISEMFIGSRVSEVKLSDF